MFIIDRFLKLELIISNKTILVTWSRSSTILPIMIGYTVAVVRLLFIFF